MGLPTPTGREQLDVFRPEGSREARRMARLDLVASAILDIARACHDCGSGPVRQPAMYYIKSAPALRNVKLPRLSFDPALPVSARREEIRAAIERHQVVIVCGETGSGKTTQLPKILLEMGRGNAGVIGHT